MYYLIDNKRGPYADIYFDEPTNGEKVIAKFEEDYNGYYKYLITDNGYEKIPVSTELNISNNLENLVEKTIMDEVDQV